MDGPNTNGIHLQNSRDANLEHGHGLRYDLANPSPNVGHKARHDQDGVLKCSIAWVSWFGLHLEVEAAPELSRAERVDDEVKPLRTSGPSRAHQATVRASGAKRNCAAGGGQPASVCGEEDGGGRRPLAQLYEAQLGYGE